MLVDKNEITKEKTPVKNFSSHFINIVKNYHGTPTYPFCQITTDRVKSYLLNRRVKSYLRLLIPKKTQVIKKKPP